jgi:hypothetical protein
MPRIFTKYLVPETSPLIAWTTGVQLPVDAMNEHFLFATKSRPILGPTQTLQNGFRELIHRRVKRLGDEADHSPPPSAEFKNEWSYPSTHPYVFMTLPYVKRRGKR